VKRIMLALSIPLLLSWPVRVRRSRGPWPRLERPVSEQPVQSDARRKAKVHVELGQAYFQAGRFGVALDEARAAATYDSGYAPVYQLMGQVHMFLEENAIAEANFAHALRLAPGDPGSDEQLRLVPVLGRQGAGRARAPDHGGPQSRIIRVPPGLLPMPGCARCGSRTIAAAEEQFLRSLESDADGNLQAIYHLAAIKYRRGAYEAWRRYIAALHEGGDPTAESLWLGIRVERRLGDRGAEAPSFSNCDGAFPASPEYQAFLQGQYQ
jgi:type IV pilus assembly protein PilF